MAAAAAFKRSLTAGLAVLWVAGCACARPRPFAQEAHAVNHHQLNVPFFSDETDQCGPSAAASVLAFWGIPTDRQALRDEAYSPRLKGTFPIDLLLATQRRGFQVSLYRGSLEDLKEDVRRGHPPIAFINRGFNSLPIGHYVVVTGYDDERGGLLVHSGPAENEFVSYKDFMRDWNKTERSTLLILPAGAERGSHAGT
jgi:hypothetical protein